jgi:hypothetical protein
MNSKEYKSHRCMRQFLYGYKEAIEDIYIKDDRIRMTAPTLYREPLQDQLDIILYLSRLDFDEDDE